MHLGAGMCPEPRWTDYPAPRSPVDSFAMTGPIRHCLLLACTSIHLHTSRQQNEQRPTSVEPFSWTASMSVSRQRRRTSCWRYRTRHPGSSGTDSDRLCRIVLLQVPIVVAHSLLTNMWLDARIIIVITIFSIIFSYSNSIIHCLMLRHWWNIIMFRGPISRSFAIRPMLSTSLQLLLLRFGDNDVVQVFWCCLDKVIINIISFSMPSYKCIFFF